MKRQEKCMSCKKTFWAKAKRNKFTKQIDTLDDLCQACKNRMRQAENAKRSNKPHTIRAVPQELEKYIRMRELEQAEMERRKEEERNAK